MSEKQDYFFAEFDYYLSRGCTSWYALCMASDEYKKVFHDDSNGEVAKPPSGPRTHSLKTWPKHFQALDDGTKRFELRENDRDFRVGDTLNLNEWDPVAEKYTGGHLYMRVTYIIQGELGLPDNMCIMSVSEFPPDEDEGQAR